jgi:hypothetical protein
MQLDEPAAVEGHSRLHGRLSRPCFDNVGRTGPIRSLLAATHTLSQQDNIDHRYDTH